jgi:hypothetical protein
MPVTDIQIKMAIEALTALAGKSRAIRSHKKPALKPARTPARPTNLSFNYGYYPDTPRSRASLMEALDHVSSDCTYGRYRDVVWALIGTGWTDAEEVARLWCETAPHRFDAQDFSSVVESFDPTRMNRPTVGTIIYLARKEGWDG